MKKESEVGDGVLSRKEIIIFGIIAAFGIFVATILITESMRGAFITAFVTFVVMSAYLSFLSIQEAGKKEQAKESNIDYNKWSMKEIIYVIIHGIIMASIILGILFALNFLGEKWEASKKEWVRENVKEVKSLVAPKSSPEMTNQLFAALQNQFLAALQNMAQNPARENEYRAAINKLANVVKGEVKKNPQAMELFLKETLDLAAKAEPGTALLIQDYANEVVKQEMTRLRQESTVAKLMEKEKQIKTLKEAGEGIKRELGQLKTAQGKKDKEIAELKSDLGLTPEQSEKEVPVLLINDLGPAWGKGKGDVNFEFIKRITGKSWIYHLENGKTLAIMLSPGVYTIKCKGATIRKTVTHEPTSLYLGKLYHCVVSAQNTEQILE